MSLLLEVIYGGAGTGKTTRLINDVKKLNSSSFIILSPTHSSLRNLINKLDINTKDSARTLYSFFQIDYENDHVIGPLKIVKHIFIDEFGLIKKELFKQILNKTSVQLHKFIDQNRIPEFSIIFHLYGDPCQLSPIYTEKRYISFKSLHRYNGIGTYVIEHDYNCLFSLKFVRESHKELLKTNYRANNDVLQLVKSIFYDVNLDVITYTSQLEVVRLIVDEGYVFISSKYEHHVPIYKLIQSMIITKFTPEQYRIINDLLFYPDSKFLVAETTSKYKNGEYVKLDHFIGNDAYLKTEDGTMFRYERSIKLLPEFLITAHKSQGLTIPKIIVCTDDLFDVSMLYTMITRASQDVLFFSNLKPDLSDYVSKFREILRFYNYISV